MTIIKSHIERFDMANEELYWYSILKIERGIDANQFCRFTRFNTSNAK